MYDWLKGLILPWLRIEDSEPHPPAGHEAHEMLRIERADPGFLRLRLLQWRLYAVAWAFVVVMASVAMVIADWRLLLVVIPLVLVAVAKAATVYVTMRLDYEMRWYVITDRSLLIREGVWNVQEITLTFANAQNVRVTQGPLERWFGFSNVEVETAGGGGSGEAGGARHNARLSGLANPQAIRAVILDVIRQQRTAGLGDPDDVEADRLMTARGVSEVRSTGAESSSAVSRSGDLLREVWSEARALRVALEGSRLAVILFLLASCRPAQEPIPITRLGAPTAALTDGFTRIASIRELADGRVLVSDEKDERLVVADFVTDSVSQVGRQGDGPGEHRQIGRIWALAGDSTLLKEPFAPRSLLLNGSQIVATVGAGDAMLNIVSMTRLVGADTLGHLMWLDYALDANGRPTLNDSLVLLRLDRNTMQIDTLARMQSAEAWSRDAGKSDAPPIVAAAEGAAPERRSYMIALAAPDEVAVFADGWVALVRAQPYRVDWCAPEQRCVQGRPLVAAMISVSDREKRAYLAVASVTHSWPPTTEPDETAGWPKTLPPFATPTSSIDASATIALTDGRLLVERLPTADVPHRRYDVVKRSGEVQQLELALNERIVGSSARYLYVAEIDTDGVQTLRRHALP